MSLFIKQIADKLAGQVAFSLPSCDGSNSYVNVVAFLSEDPVIKLGNKWEPLISDINTINEFSQIAGFGQASWLATSKMAWKGTDPITVTLNFYLITYLKSQVDGITKGNVMPVSKQAMYFAQLATVSQNDDASGFWSNLKIGVHGGYKPDYFTYNNEVVSGQKVMTMKDEEKAQTSWTNFNDADGTVQIIINGNGHNSVIFTDMLLESVDFTPSTVRAGYWNDIPEVNGRVGQSRSFKGSKEPLYIKVSASFKGMRVATVRDAKMLFNVRGE